MNARGILLLTGVALAATIATAAESAATAKTAGARLADAGVTAQVGAGYAGAKRYTMPTPDNGRNRPRKTATVVLNGR